MSVIFILIPLSIVIATGFLFAFVWAVKSGQYDDVSTPSMRVLIEEPGVAGAQHSEKTRGAGAAGLASSSLGELNRRRDASPTRSGDGYATRDSRSQSQPDLNRRKTGQSLRTSAAANALSNQNPSPHS